MPVSAASPVSSAAAGLRLRDETFDPAQPGGYNLYLSASPSRLTVAVADVERRKFVALEDHALPSGGLPALAGQHDFLTRRGWNEVRLALTGRAFTLLPAPLFRPGDEAAALRLHHPLAPTETARYHAHPALELVNVFAADHALADWLTTTHGTAGRLLHHTSALLAGLTRPHTASAAHRLCLHLGQHELTLVVLGAQLEYCNVFAFASADDVLYYTILVMQELGLNPDQDEVTVWGELTHDSALFTLLRTYLRHLRFGPRPDEAHYSYRLNDVLDHRYFDLLSLHLV